MFPTAINICRRAHAVNVLQITGRHGSGTATPSTSKTSVFHNHPIPNCDPSSDAYNEVCDCDDTTDGAPAQRSRSCKQVQYHLQPSGQPLLDLPLGLRSGQIQE